MTVTVRPYRSGGWEVDIMLTLDDGRTHRERRKSPVSSKSKSLAWGRERERHLLEHGPTPKRRARILKTEPSLLRTEDPNRKEVPTLAEFSPRYIEGYARANREKPSSIDAKESILRNYLIPAFGSRRLDDISQEDIQVFKGQMAHLSNKTINNALTVLNTLFKCAVDWGLLETVPVTIRFLRVAQPRVEFYDFADFERLVAAAAGGDPRSLLVVLLGGEAGLRRGEIIALEWSRIDLERRLLTIDRAQWRSHVGLPKGKRLRIVPMTARLSAALTAHPRGPGPRVLYRDDGTPATAKLVRTWLNLAQRQADLPDKGPHTLRHTFCSHLAMRGVPAPAIQQLAGHVDLSTTQRYIHLSPAALERAIEMLEQRSVPAGPHPTQRPGSAVGPSFGDAVETGRS